MSEELVLPSNGPKLYTSLPKRPSIIDFLTEFKPDPELLNREYERFKKINAKKSYHEDVKRIHEAILDQKLLVDISVVLPIRYERLPRLAVGRVSDRTVYCRVHYKSGTVEFRRGLVTADDDRSKVFYEFSSDDYVEIHNASQYVTFKAAVPHLPPELGNIKIKDKTKFILWEADWRKVSSVNHPRPKDPALLEHIAGSIYSVLAVWELSEVESAALARPLK